MPPIDATAEARRRADLLTEVEAHRKSGLSVTTACIKAGTKVSNYYRDKKNYAKGGLKGLEPDWKNCGRKPMVVLNELEVIAVKQGYVKNGSVTLALREFATTEACSQEAADAILKIRASKHNIPRSIRHQVELPAVVMEYHKSPKRARTNFFINPRTLTYLDPLGQEQPLRAGDLSERDDMSNNFLVWVDWPWGGDPCSDKFGVRIARGQLLCQIDVRWLYFQSFCFLVRLRDSYRADDIWQWVGQTYRDRFVPAIGERWERGIWSANKLRGYPIEAGHTPNEARIGGIQALGRRVIESHSPTTKIIENRFNFFQTACSTIPGQIGRSRAEMERENKLWTECREGRRDPRRHFLSMAKATELLEAKMQFINHEPMEGTLYRGVPAEGYSREIAERGDELKPLAPEQAYLFARDLRFTTCTKAHAMVRYTLPEGGRKAWWFHAEQLYRYEGKRMAVYMDEACPEAGAVVVPIEPGKKPQPIACELVDGMPQFALGIDIECGPAAQAMVDASLRRDRQNAAYRAEYRAIGLAGRRLAKTSTVRDGAGNAVEISSHFTPRRQKAESTEPAGGRPSLSQTDRKSSTRNTAPLSSDPDYMRRLEQQFDEANPGLAIT